MDLACPQCSRSVHIEDSKVPEGVFKVRCPGCGKIITAEREPTSPAATRTQQSSTVPPAMEAFVKREIAALRQEILELVKGVPATRAQNVSPADESGQNPGNFALVCENDPSCVMTISNTLKQMGYSVEIASTTAESLKKLEAKSYRIITVDSAFPDDREGGSKIIGWINKLKPAARRMIFVANVSANTRTIDAGSAFFQGTNIAVNKADLPNFENLIREGLQQFQHFYQLFQRLITDKERLV